MWDLGSLVQLEKGKHSRVVGYRIIKFLVTLLPHNKIHLLTAKFLKIRLPKIFQMVLMRVINYRWNSWDIKNAWRTKSFLRFESTAAQSSYEWKLRLVLKCKTSLWKFRSGATFSRMKYLFCLRKSYRNRDCSRLARETV